MLAFLRGFRMRSAALLLALCFAAGSARADILLSTGLRSNHSGQITANYVSANNSFFDVFIDVQDANGNSFCIPTDPCFPPNPDRQTTETSRQLDASYFKLSFQALMNGNPITVTGAGLNQKQTQTDSFFDIYFTVDLGNGNSQEGALGIHAAPQPPPITRPLL